MGLGAAMLSRIVLLFSLAWVMPLTTPLLSLFGQAISGRDLILILGGLFLLAKSIHEIHTRVEGEEEHAAGSGASSFAGVILQIFILDVVFSLDSVITAIGMADHVAVMVAAVVMAVAFMMAFAGMVGDFVQRHQTVKMLTLVFLLMIGLSLVDEGLDRHIPKGYIYFPMVFSVFVEILNMLVRARAAV